MILIPFAVVMVIKSEFNDYTLHVKSFKYINCVYIFVNNISLFSGRQPTPDSKENLRLTSTGADQGKTVLGINSVSASMNGNPFHRNQKTIYVI